MPTLPSSQQYQLTTRNQLDINVFNLKTDYFQSLFTFQLQENMKKLSQLNTFKPRKTTISYAFLKKNKEKLEELFL